MDTGKPKTFKAGPDGEEKFYTVGHVAPCKTGWKCPKESPEKEREHLLSPKNDRVHLLYQWLKAGCVAAVGPIDPLLADLLSICDACYCNHDRVERTTNTQHLMNVISKARI